MRLTISPINHDAFFWPGALVWVAGTATGIWAAVESVTALWRFLCS